MKTFRILGMALFAVLMCANFASCSSEEVTPDDPNQDKYITVGLNCVGEYLDITESPLSRATGSDTYKIQVYSSSGPYAYGEFKSLDEVSVKLMQDEKYFFKVAIIVGGGYGSYKQFDYSSSDNMSSILSSRFIDITKEGFYGQLSDYIPKEGESVEICTKRVSYAAKFVAENLSEGKLTIDVATTSYLSIPNNIYSIELTPDTPTSDNIYSFCNTYDAWKGIQTETGDYDSETGEPIYEYKNYSKSKKLTVNWEKTNGEVIPLGAYNVTFKRNVRTTVRINVAELPSFNNGITVTKEETAITDDENEYEISGGEIVEVPVNSEP